MEEVAFIFFNQEIAMINQTRSSIRRSRLNLEPLKIMLPGFTTLDPTPLRWRIIAAAMIGDRTIKTPVKLSLSKPRLLPTLSIQVFWMLTWIAKRLIIFHFCRERERERLNIEVHAVASPKPKIFVRYVIVVIIGRSAAGGVGAADGGTAGV